MTICAHARERRSLGPLSRTRLSEERDVQKRNTVVRPGDCHQLKDKGIAMTQRAAGSTTSTGPLEQEGKYPGDFRTEGGKNRQWGGKRGQHWKGGSMAFADGRAASWKKKRESNRPTHEPERSKGHLLSGNPSSASNQPPTCPGISLGEIKTRKRGTKSGGQENPKKIEE